jgi:hypothetical protein
MQKFDYSLSFFSPLTKIKRSCPTEQRRMKRNFLRILHDQSDGYCLWNIYDLLTVKKNKEKRSLHISIDEGHNFFARIARS